MKFNCVEKEKDLSSILICFQTPQLNNKEDLIRELHHERRIAEAAAMKKKLDEEQLLVRIVKIFG